MLYFAANFKLIGIKYLISLPKTMYFPESLQRGRSAHPAPRFLCLCSQNISIESKKAAFMTMHKRSHEKKKKLIPEQSKAYSQ